MRPFHQQVATGMPSEAFFRNDRSHGGYPFARGFQAINAAANARR